MKLILNLTQCRKKTNDARTSANPQVLISQPHAANHHVGIVGTVGR